MDFIFSFNFNLIKIIILDWCRPWNLLAFVSVDNGRIFVVVYECQAALMEFIGFCIIILDIKNVWHIFSFNSQ